MTERPLKTSVYEATSQLRQPEDSSGTGSEVTLTQKALREARIAQIRSRLAEGTYRISSEQIASNLMKRMTQRAQSPSELIEDISPSDKTRGEGV